LNHMSATTSILRSLAAIMRDVAYYLRIC
jgi:hypothetical protein